MGIGNLPSFAALPLLMGFAKSPESLFFYGQVALASLVIAMTDFNAGAPGAAHEQRNNLPG